jgi:K+-transporting ATPase c subunit
MEEVTASTRCRNVLVVTGSAAKEVAEFIVLSAEPAGRVMLLEAVHTSGSSLDPAMVLFKSIIQIDARSVADVAAQR